MIPAGKYRGLITIDDYGRCIIEQLQAIPDSTTKRNSLNDVWKPDASFTLSQLKSELIRNGILINNNLHLSGRRVRSLYRYLEASGAVESVDMTTVYRCFAGSFKLRFKGVSSLQRIKDYPDTWADELALLRPITNAIPNSDIMNVNSEI